MELLLELNNGYKAIVLYQCDKNSFKKNKYLMEGRECFLKIYQERYEWVGEEHFFNYEKQDFTHNNIHFIFLDKNKNVIGYGILYDSEDEPLFIEEKILKSDIRKDNISVFEIRRLCFEQKGISYLFFDALRGFFKLQTLYTKEQLLSSVIIAVVFIEKLYKQLESNGFTSLEINDDEKEEVHSMLKAYQLKIKTYME